MNMTTTHINSLKRLFSIFMLVPVVFTTVSSSNENLRNSSLQLYERMIEETKSTLDIVACDIKKASLTTAASSPLPPPSDDLVLKHVAIGRGTQNYTCSTNPNDVPSPIGASARMFDASCIASENPDVLAQLPNSALQIDLPTDETETLTNSNLEISGHHFFEDSKTAIFDLRTTAADIGIARVRKVNSAAPPPNAVVGKDNKGDGAIPWLELLATEQNAPGLKQVYRVNTAGGSPPKNCAGMPTNFEVQYAAEYWFFEKKI